MKFFSVALISALAFATVAVAAPSTTSNISLKDLAWSSPMDGTLEKLFGNVKCLHDVTSDGMEMVGLEELYANIKPKLDEIFDVEWKKCIQLKDSFDKESCKFNRISEATFQIGEFWDEIRMIDVMLTSILQSEYSDRCIEAFQNGIIEEVFEKDFKGVEYFKCIGDAITAGVHEIDIADHWKEHKEDLEAAIERLHAYIQEKDQENISVVPGEIFEFYDIVNNRFLGSLEKDNYEQVRQYMRERCY